MACIVAATPFVILALTDIPLVIAWVKSLRQNEFCQTHSNSYDVTSEEVPEITNSSDHEITSSVTAVDVPVS